MANLEYDDFEDVSGSEEGDIFNEDELDDKEYDELYKYLPQVKTSMSSYNDNIPETDLKEALYYNYFELDKTIEELKSRFPKKRTKSSRKYFFFFFFFSKKVHSFMFQLLGPIRYLNSSINFSYRLLI